MHIFFSVGYTPYSYKAYHSVSLTRHLLSVCLCIFSDRSRTVFVGADFAVSSFFHHADTLCRPFLLHREQKRTLLARLDSPCFTEGFKRVFLGVLCILSLMCMTMSQDMSFQRNQSFFGIFVKEGSNSTTYM